MYNPVSYSGFGVHNSLNFLADFLQTNQSKQTNRSTKRRLSVIIYLGLCIGATCKCMFAQTNTIRYNQTNLKQLIIAKVNKHDFLLGAPSKSSFYLLS